jgi:hypothetical protein
MPGFSFKRAGRRGGARLLPGSAAGLAVLLLVPAAATAQFAVYPTVVTLSPQPGEEVVTSVWLRNEGNHVREFRLDVQDFDQDAEGTPSFYPAGTRPRSCAARLQVYPEAATLAPGETQEIRVRFTGSDRACWVALMTEALVQEAPGIVARQQIGVRINGIPPASVLEGEITRLEVEDSAVRALHLWFHNTGDAPVRPAGQVELRDAAGTPVATVDVLAFSVLPGSTRRISVPLDRRLAPGRYTAIPVLDFGGEYLAGGQTTFGVR